MSITITGTRSFTTPVNSLIAANQATFSVAFKMRFEANGIPSQSNGNYFVARNAGRSFAFIMMGGTSTTVSIKIQCTNASDSTVSTTVSVPIGAVTTFALVYTSGSQRVYINAILATIGSLTGNSQGTSVNFQVGGTAGSACIYTLDDIAVWNGYALTASDVLDLREGTATPATIGGSATWRGYWTLDGTDGATPQIGDPGLANYFSDPTTNLTSVSGSGSALYSAALDWVPSVAVQQAYVDTTGSLVGLSFQSLTAGGTAIPSQVITAPTASVNGTPIGSLTNQWLTGYHSRMLFQLPGSTVVSANDVVTLDAPEGWLNTNLGLTEALNASVLISRVGQSSVGTSSITKTLKVGLNFPHLGAISWSLYQVPKNWVTRTTKFSNCTIDSGGKPTAMTLTTVGARLYDLSASNGIDSTSYPGAVGLYAIGWDDLNPSVPTTFSMTTALPATTTVTELTQYANPGVNGIGKVKVFNVQQAIGSTTALIELDLQMTNANKSPQFANLVIYGPGDFTPGSPTVLDRSNPLATTATFQSRLAYPLGSARWVDSTIGFAGSSSQAEPEDCRNITDFTWGDGVFKRSINFGYSQARPFVIGPTSYVYSTQFGSPFSATLASPIDSTTATLAISDAATAPVIEGLTLTVDSEIMRVQSVSGTTVTVTRGALGTSAAPHAAGTIQVNNRFLVTSLAQIGGTDGLVTELVSSASHHLRTGQFADWAGTWPTFTYTDGTTASFTGYGRVVFVTGQNSYVCGIFNAQGGSPVTLAGTVSLNPSSQTTALYIPDVGFPFEYVAQVTGGINGCDIHVNVPHAASDALVDEIATRIRDNFPAGRNVFVELSNETWNLFFIQNPYFQTVDRLLGQSANAGKYWYVTRAGQVWQRFRNIFNTGVTRGAEIKGLLNVHTKVLSEATTALSIAAAQGIAVGALAVAPYINSDTSSDSVTAYNTYGDSQVATLWIHDLMFNTAVGGWPDIFTNLNAAIASYNTDTSNSCVLYGYEGGVSFPFPSGVTYATERLRDLVYNPYWYFTEQDFYAFLQTSGFFRENIYSYDMQYSNNAAWGMYHWVDQPFGRGDGSIASDGRSHNNLLCLAQPGQPNSKAPTTNLDQQQCCVRGQALYDWLQAIANGGGPPDPPPPTGQGVGQGGQQFIFRFYGRSFIFPARR